MDNSINTSVLIVTKCTNDLVYDCMQSIADKTTVNYEFVIGYTGTDEAQFQKLKEKAAALNKNSKVLQLERYNFAKNNNFLFTQISPDSKNICFCNDDVKLIDDCIDTGAATLNNDTQRRIGTLGFKLLFKDGTIQHAGQCLYIDKDNKFVGVSHFMLKYKNIEIPSIVVVGNTAALLMMHREAFVEVGMFNEDYIECFEDVELNFRCVVADKVNVCVCSKTAWHFESQSRNLDADKMKRTNIDADKMKKYFNDHADKITAVDSYTIVRLKS